MLPKDGHTYLNLDEGRKLQTINSLYKFGQESVNNVWELYNIEGKTPVVQNAAKAAYDTLKESLLFGKDEAATGLAYLHGEGLGVDRNFDKRRLFVLIGAKLENEDCNKLMISEKEAGQNYDKVEDEAKKWVETIKEIDKKYPDKNQELTTRMIVEATNVLDVALKPNNLAANMKQNQQSAAKINAAASAAFTPAPTPKVSHHHNKKTACCAIM
jgi:hypothetical protein